MSGFALILHPPGKSADPELTRRVAAAVAQSGPDRQDHRIEGRAEMFHALLATTFEERADRQPLSFDGQVHIVADARIDGREALVAALTAGGRPARRDEPDSALILHAYLLWGEGCAARLIGDFAFAIWDARDQSLFCARDQIGLVPFYHGFAGDTLIVADTAHALLAHPGIDRGLDRGTIADYLLFGFSTEAERGFFRNIRRLAPAHWLRWRDGTLRVERYWQPPEAIADPGAPSASSADDAVAEFAGLLEHAVRDRMRTDRIACTISGGMDSTTVTALAHRHVPAGGRVDAYCGGWDWMLPDTERYWAGLCAEHIGVPFHSLSSEALLPAPGDPQFRDVPELRFGLRPPVRNSIFHPISQSGARVLLMGMGGDMLAAGGLWHWRRMTRDRRYGLLAAHAWQYWRRFRKRPPLRGAFTEPRVRDVPVPPIPFDPDFAAEQRVAQRWTEHRMRHAAADPRAVLSANTMWAEMFAAFDPESTGLPMKVRQPLLDIRLIEAALRLPPTPWLFQKEVLRHASSRWLPPEILKRPKTAFGRDVEWELARRGHGGWIERVQYSDRLSGILNLQEFRKIAASPGEIPEPYFHQLILFPTSLDYWLEKLERHS